MRIYVSYLRGNHGKMDLFNYFPSVLVPKKGSRKLQNSPQREFMRRFLICSDSWNPRGAGAASRQRACCNPFSEDMTGSFLICIFVLLATLRLHTIKTRMCPCSTGRHSIQPKCCRTFDFDLTQEPLDRPTDRVSVCTPGTDKKLQTLKFLDPGTGLIK